MDCFSTIFIITHGFANVVLLRLSGSKQLLKTDEKMFLTGVTGLV
jgi:hypothetical protein